MIKKYKSIFHKSKIYCIFIIILIDVLFLEKILASGAYDKGSSTGKGRFEISITINPYGLIPYGQNYSVMSYGLNEKLDLVGYYSLHQNGTESQYLGVLYQFYKSKKLDLATAIGMRYQNSGINDLFAPQLLYNYHLNENYSVGGSFVKVIQKSSLNDKGIAVDLTLYRNMDSFIFNDKIKNIYIGLGIFKNSEKNLLKDRLYFHYSLDIVF